MMKSHGDPTSEIGVFLWLMNCTWEGVLSSDVHLIDASNLVTLLYQELERYVLEKVLDLLVPLVPI